MPFPTRGAQTAMKVAAIGCLLPLALVFGYVVVASIDQSTRPASSAESNPKIGAVEACKHATRLQLKAPSTADFAPWEEWTAYRDGTKRVVTGYVDAQNSFGAKLRNNIRCEVYDEGANLRAFAHLTAR